MGHTQLINKMSHNSCIELVNRKVPCPPEEPKRYFHHPFGMAYRINNEWVPCPGYGDKSVAPQPPEDRERIPAAEWRPKKPTPPVLPPRVLSPPREELDRLVEKHGMSLAAIGRLKKCSATTVHNWFKQHKLKTPAERKKLAEEEQS